MAKHFSIQCTAVIGAGTMGSQIAAVIVGSNTPVLLLDIASGDTSERSAVSKRAIEKLNNQLSKQKIALIQSGNMEDDLDKLKDVDWVIECTPEKLETKRDLYEKVGQYIKSTALISSTTSTIPLSELKKDLNDTLQGQLFISHFFNPPSKMPLLELVADEYNNTNAIASFTRFADRNLGRNVIFVKDTLGFIANRIGVFWLLCAMEEARKEGLDMKTADAVMNGAFGFPKTGIFALADLIGLKLISEISESICRFLSKEDPFCQLEGLTIIKERLQSGADSAGFYHGKDKSKSSPVSIEHWHEFLDKNKPESRFAKNVLVRMLGYTANVTSVIADRILQVDAAMRDGYGWGYGPFEMIDRLGSAWLAEHMIDQGMSPQTFLKQAGMGGSFYRIREGIGKEYLGFSGRYRIQKPEKDKWTLALLTAGKKPLLHNTSAELYDIGDGIVCFSLTKGKMHVIDEAALDLLQQTVEKAETEFKGIIIGHDGRNFSAGLDLHIILESIENFQYNRIGQILQQGQHCFMSVKQSKVPVVAAICGYTLGGGCELAMYCTAVQAYSDTHIGLVETDIGVIPAWGGTKEYLLRAVKRGGDDADMIIQNLTNAFRHIANAKKSINADDAFSMGILDASSRISVNRERLLPAAKSLCLELAVDYVPKSELVIEAPVELLYRSLEHEITECIQQEHPSMTQHRCKTLKTLADVLSGKSAVKVAQQTMTQEPQRAGWDKFLESMVMQSERKAFIELVQEKEVLEKIKSVLKV